VSGLRLSPVTALQWRDRVRSRVALKAGVVPAFIIATEPACCGASEAQAVVPFTSYVAAFNSESPANQITLGHADVREHISHAVALNDALRQEGQAELLGSALGAFKSAPYHYKAFIVWVFAFDPIRAHVQPTPFPSRKAVNSEYNYDIVIVRAGSGAVVEEATGLGQEPATTSALQGPR
jgi:hypothetical protein